MTRDFGGGLFYKAADMAKKKPLTAKNADRHDLYQRSVNAPDFEVELLDRVFKKHAGRNAVLLREDFCGTGLLCKEWVTAKKGRKAIGLDIDREVLAWGQKRNIAPLGELSASISLRDQDVLIPTKEKADLIVAFNYSYQCFHDRATLLRYFRAAHQSLPKDGLFVLDMIGGWESQQTLVEKRKKPGFTYVWEQADYNPVDARFLCYIHFHFPGGSKMQKAFTYDWRLWNMAEVKDVLREVGFVDVDILWEGDGEDGTGDGVFRKVTRARNDPGWNAYLVAKKQPSLTKAAR